MDVQLGLLVILSVNLVSVSPQWFKRDSTTPSALFTPCQRHPGPRLLAEVSLTLVETGTANRA